MEPIYRTDGAWVGIYKEGHIFNTEGDWLGFVVGREVYDPVGEYLGFLSDDRRLLRKKSPPERPKRTVPAQPERPQVPASMPLAPLMPEIPFHIVDVFEEEGERLMYVSETRPDMQ